jgi:hypothetical protein
MYYEDVVKESALQHHEIIPAMRHGLAMLSRWVSKNDLHRSADLEKEFRVAMQNKGQITKEK